MGLKDSKQALHIRNKQWTVEISRERDWVTINNKRFSVFCFSSGAIEIMDGNKLVYTSQ